MQYDYLFLDNTTACSVNFYFLDYIISDISLYRCFNLNYHYIYMYLYILYFLKLFTYIYFLHKQKNTTGFLLISKWN